MKLIGYTLCKVDDRGRADPVHHRKTFKAILRLADRYPNLFVVSAFVAVDGKADDGTVYFFDINGGLVEMATI